VVLDNFEQLPGIGFTRKTGSTDYIDFLQPADLSAPIMKGIDRFGRRFIA
jgi:hypothetical protein